MCLGSKGSKWSLKGTRRSNRFKRGHLVSLWGHYQLLGVSREVLVVVLESLEGPREAKVVQEG